jgi:DNA-binding NtrC family response regulator
MNDRDESPLDQLAASVMGDDGNKVLIVEDDPIVTQVVSDILSALGFSVPTAENGSNAHFSRHKSR